MQPRIIDDLLSDYILSHDLAEESEHYYRRMVGVLCSWAGRRIPLSDFTPAIVNRMLLYKQRAGLSSHYRRSLRNAMRALLAFHCGGPVTGQLRSVQLDDLVIRVWTAAEVAILIAACGYMRESSKREWWRTIIAAGYYTGLSSVDLWRLRHRDITAQGRLAIRRSKTRKPVVATIPEPWLSALRQLSWQQELVWGRPMATQVFQATFRRIVSKAGLSGTFKQLRKSCGTSIEMRYPGRGHIALGNSRAVFEKHYFSHEALDGEPMRPQDIPPPPPQDLPPAA